jgi:hypothetical protein
MPCCCGCCERGGCCRQAPGKVIRATGEDNRIARVNWLYEPAGCFSNDGGGLSDEPPNELFTDEIRRDAFESVRSLEWPPRNLAKY